MALNALMALITLGAIVLWVTVRYNALMSLRNQVENGWKRIDVQLKRRHDLIPSLVDAVQGIMELEQETLDKVISARSDAISARGAADSAAKESSLTDALCNFFLVVEQHPQLRSSENVRRLQEELTAAENKIVFARRFYNDIAMEFNIAQQAFPARIIAASFRFQLAELFEIPAAAEREVPAVSP